MVSTFLCNGCNSCCKIRNRNDHFIHEDKSGWWILGITIVGLSFFVKKKRLKKINIKIFYFQRSIMINGPTEDKTELNEVVPNLVNILFSNLRPFNILK